MKVMRRTKKKKVSEQKRKRNTKMLIGRGIYRGFSKTFDHLKSKTNDVKLHESEFKLEL